MMGLKTLAQQLTDLLMENGAAVTKPAIAALVDFIGIRDQAIIDKVIRDAEAALRRLQQETITENDL